MDNCNYESDFDEYGVRTMVALSCDPPSVFEHTKRDLGMIVTLTPAFVLLHSFRVRLSAADVWRYALVLLDFTESTCVVVMMHSNQVTHRKLFGKSHALTQLLTRPSLRKKLIRRP